ncbi:MAG: hypothetical protein Q9195_002431 [Heterodermia aff. obscurata]
MAYDLLARPQTLETAISVSSPTAPIPPLSRDNAHDDTHGHGLDKETDNNGQINKQGAVSPITAPADEPWKIHDEFEKHIPTPAIDVPLANGYKRQDYISDKAPYLESKYTEESPLEQFLRNRRPSITFHPEVKTDTGDCHSLANPISKLEINTKWRNRSPLPEAAKPVRRSTLSRTYSGEDSQRAEHLAEFSSQSTTNRSFSLPKRRFSANRSPFPLLQSSLDHLPSPKEQPEFEGGVSLTSDSTASYGVSEARTPTDLTMDCLVSPISSFSPFHHPVSLEESSAWPKPRRQGSNSRPQSYTFDRRLSQRSTRSRRSTSGSQKSPATAFLAKFNPKESEELQPEPDGEGQEVGEYVLGRQVGFGGFSLVREAYTIEGDERVLRAVKIVRRQIPNKDDSENDQFQAEFEHEVRLWRCLGHRHILPLIAVYNTPFATFCFTKLNTGGTLFDLVRRNRKGLSSDLARRYAYQLASAMRYLHEDMRIVHRDIKLENCLLDLSAPNADQAGGNLLLCDFGLAEFISRTPSRRASPCPSSDNTPYGTPPPPQPPATTKALEDDPMPRHHIAASQFSTSVAGSLQYAAPELIASPAGLLSTAVDIWAFGVVIYALLVGDLPFQHTFQPKVQMMIQAGEWDAGALRAAPGVGEQGREDEVEDVVAGCLCMSSEERWTVGEVLGCGWLEGCQEVVEEEGRGWKL